MKQTKLDLNQLTPLDGKPVSDSVSINQGGLLKIVVKNKSLGLILMSSLFFLSCGQIDSLSSGKLSDQKGAESPTPAPAEDLTTVQNYIVVLKQNPTLLKSTQADAKVQVNQSLEKIQQRFQIANAVHVFTAALHGGVYKLSGQQAQQLAKDESVAYVEKDQIIHLSAAQANAPWGLDRIDQSGLPLDKTFSYSGSGTGVNAYVIDTGILFSHQEFGGRAVSGADFVDNDGDATDCNGHGTHVSGTIGGKTFGVAKNVNLIGVRVLDCNGSGSYSGVIAGVDWVTANHKKPAVANMSLGGPISQALEDAIANSIKAGVTYALAAGNDNQSACLSSPSRMANAIKVGSTTNTDQRSSFSNFGPCVDIFAPGSDIESAWDTSPSSTNTISGTSMATPHTTGVLALYLEKNPASSPDQAKAALIAGSISGKVASAGTGSPNKLLNTAFIVGAVPPPPPVDNSVLSNGVVTAAIAGAKSSEKVFTLPISAGAKNLVIEMSGGQPDADLYVKFGAKPSTSAYDCRPYTSNNNEKCSVSAPSAGVYYVVVRGYSDFSGVVIKASYSVK